MSSKQIAELATLATQAGARLTLDGQRVTKFSGVGGELAVTFQRGYTCCLRRSDPEFVSLVRQLHWFAKGVEA